MKWVNVLNVIGLLITLIGLITGYYIFLFLILPLGLIFFNKKTNKDE